MGQESMHFSRKSHNEAHIWIPTLHKRSPIYRNQGWKSAAPWFFSNRRPQLRSLVVLAWILTYGIITSNEYDDYNFFLLLFVLLLLIK